MVERGRVPSKGFLELSLYLGEDFMVGEDLDGRLVSLRGQRGSVATDFLHG